MIRLKTEYPFIEQSGILNSKMIKFYAEDEKGFRYKVKNQQTGKVLDEAVSVYPAHFTYEVVEEKCAIQPKIEEIEEKKPVEKKKDNWHKSKDKFESVAKKNVDKVLEISETEILEDKNNIEEKDENENELY